MSDGEAQRPDLKVLQGGRSDVGRGRRPSEPDSLIGYVTTPELDVVAEFCQQQAQAWAQASENLRAEAARRRARLQMQGGGRLFEAPPTAPRAGSTGRRRSNPPRAESEQAELFTDTSPAAPATPTAEVPAVGTPGQHGMLEPHSDPTGLETLRAAEAARYQAELATALMRLRETYRTTPAEDEFLVSCAGQPDRIAARDDVYTRLEQALLERRELPQS